MNIQIYYILSARHYLFGSLITKADNTLQHALFVLDIILVSQLQSLFQIINTQDVIFLLHYLSASIPLFRSTFSKGQKILRAIKIPPTKRLQKSNGSLRLYTFGIISPKSKRRNVSRTVIIRNCSQYAFAPK